VSNTQARESAERGRRARESLESFDRFYKRYQPRLTRYLISLASDAGMAEDVAQETMMAASIKWDGLLTYERPDSWLFKVATRKLSRLEARAREQCLLPDDLASAEADLRLAAADDEWVDDHIDLIVALRSLPRRQCEVIGLHFFGGYTLAETAAIIGIKEGTAKQHLHRGLARLRQHHSNPPVAELSIGMIPA
jgi:RNA polymerase sigma-70 factor (ECF subfamily)